MHDLIEWLGGAERMERVRTEKSAVERYPAAMARLRALLDAAPRRDARRAARRDCSSWRRCHARDDEPVDAGRVNLLTLHSTKGLEFSRVYVVGVEDGVADRRNADTPASDEEIEEARRLLYVGMTRAKDRLVFTHVARRKGEGDGRGADSWMRWGLWHQLQLRVVGSEYLVAGLAYWPPEVGAPLEKLTAVLGTNSSVPGTAVAFSSELGVRVSHRVLATRYWS